MEMVVCKKLRYPLTAKGNVDKSFEPRVLRERCVISKEFVEEWNKDNANVNGVFYIVDKEATKAYYEECKAKNEVRRGKKELEETIAAAKIGELATRTAATLIAGQTKETSVIPPPVAPEPKEVPPATPIDLTPDKPKEVPLAPPTSPTLSDPLAGTIPKTEDNKQTPKSQTTAKNQAAKGK